MYIKEDKVINTLSDIEKVEIKCTLSNGETLLYEIPKTRTGPATVNIFAPTPII